MSKDRCWRWTSGKSIPLSRDINALNINIWIEIVEMPQCHDSITNMTRFVQKNEKSKMNFCLTTYFMPQCPYTVTFLGVKLYPAAFSLFVVAASVVVQVCLFMCLASFGDFGPYRKIILMQSAFLGAISLMCIFFCDDPSQYNIAAGLVCIANALFGLSIVMYNAYLPFLTKSHPSFMAKMKEFKDNKSSVKKHTATDGAKNTGSKNIGHALRDLLKTYGDLQVSRLSV